MGIRYYIHTILYIYKISFSAAASEEEEEEDGKTPYDKAIMPEIVLQLQASDDFLRVRVMNLPESVVASTHNTEEGLLRRLAEYAKISTDDETVTNYFDQLEIDIQKISKKELFCTYILVYKEIFGKW